MSCKDWQEFNVLSWKRLKIKLNQETSDSLLGRYAVTAFILFTEHALKCPMLLFSDPQKQVLMPMYPLSSSVLSCLVLLIPSPAVLCLPFCLFCSCYLFLFVVMIRWFHLQHWSQHTDIMRIWHWSRPRSCTFTSAGTNISFWCKWTGCRVTEAVLAVYHSEGFWKISGICSHVLFNFSYYLLNKTKDPSAKIMFCVYITSLNSSKL